jgi:hypothetical protein
MLIDRSPPMKTSSRVPQMAARADVGRRYPRTRTVGRPSTPVESRLCMLLLTHLQHWSVQDTEDQVDQNMSPRVLAPRSRRHDAHPLVAHPAVGDRASTGGSHSGTGPAGEGDHEPDSALGRDLCADRDPSSDRQREARWTACANSVGSSSGPRTVLVATGAPVRQRVTRACGQTGARPRPCIATGTRKGEDTEAEQKKPSDARRDD